MHLRSMPYPSHTMLQSHTKQSRARNIQNSKGRNKTVAQARRKKQKRVGNGVPGRKSLKSVPLVEFSLFQKLPLELKLMIWEFAVWRPRTISLKIAYTPSDLGLDIKGQRPVGVPPIFHVNHESRDLANKIFEKVSSIRSADPSTAFIHINSSADILCLAHRSGGGFSRAVGQILKRYPAWGKIKHVAVRTPKNGWGIKCICHFFPNVEQITVQTMSTGLYGDSGRQQRWWVEKLNRRLKQRYGRELTAKVTMTDIIPLEPRHTVLHEVEWGCDFPKQSCKMLHFYEDDH
jgi:hypothetical protein